MGGGGGGGRAEIDDDSLFVYNWLRSTSSALSPGAQQNEMLREAVNVRDRRKKDWKHGQKLFACVWTNAEESTTEAMLRRRVIVPFW